MKSAAPRLQGALIGCGFVSRFHVEGWAKVSQARLAALCDLDRQRLEQAAAKLPGARLYTAAAALFESEQGLDFVEICRDLHPARVASHSLTWLRRSGVHVLCQKPSAAVRSDLGAMIRACDSSGIRLMFHENRRFRSWYRALRAEISAGTIGRPICLRIAHRDTRALREGGYDDQPYFRTMPRLILLEMGCHLVDTARFLIGEVATVSAALGKFGSHSIGEDVATLSLQFASGCMGLLDMSWCAPADLARAEWCSTRRSWREPPGRSGS